MPELLFRLNGVSDEEADEVRALLDDHSIEYYETTAGRWGVSMPAIWLPDEQEPEEAKKLLENYQAERSERVRAELNEMISNGTQPTVWTKFWSQPFKFVLAVVALAFVVGLTVYPFLSLIDD